MKSDFIYFGDSGLTSTSANHIANMAKESLKEVVTELGCVSFYGSTVTTIEGSTPQTAKVGSTHEQLNKVQDMLEAVGNTHALIAWLREAIKARERLLGEVRNMTLEGYTLNVLGGADLPRPEVSFDEFCEERGYDKPDTTGEFRMDISSNSFLRTPMGGTSFSRFCAKFGIEIPKEPSIQPSMTEADYQASLSVKERNRILMLEAQASTIGKYIHEDGHLAKQREKLRLVVINPIAIEGEGRDKLIYHFDPSVTQSEVDGLFFRLAARHRELQAELNGVLAEQARAIEADKQAKAAQYQREYAEYAAERNKIMDRMTAYLNEQRKRLSELQSEFENWKNEQQNRHKQLCADLEAYKLSEAKRIADLGIIIPNELRPIYEKIQGLGK